MAKIMFEVGAKLDKQTIDGVQKQLAEAKKRLEHVVKMDGKDLIDETSMIQEIEKVSRAMEVSFRDSLGKLDTSQFKKQLKNLDVDIKDFGNRLSEVVDVDGTESFRNLTKEVKRTEVQLKQTKGALDKAFDTFTKTAYWSVANKGVQAIGDSVQRAIGYTKALDESLNNIRVVTGKSDTEMSKFADDANKAARALGRTTTDYTDGALLYLQQGKSMSEAAELTKQTLIAANITGQDTTETAEMLTAALNGYNLAASDAARVTDIFANVGAKSGADFRELATGFSRVASMGKTVGVSFEQLTAQIATISTVTREAPESIGNALKTVYARMSQIKLTGKVDDENGVSYTLGNVERALSTIGLSVKDENDNLRDMGEVLEDVGNKWSSLGKEQKSAVTEALAGTRQANKLIALFNQWPMYLEQLENAENASGAAAEQNEIRMDSIAAKANQLKATLEDLYAKLNIDDILKASIEGLTTLIEKVNQLIDSFGGIQNVALVVGGILASVFSTQIVGSITKIGTAVGNLGTTFAALSGNKKLASMAGMDEEQSKEYKEQYKASKALQPDEFEAYKETKKKTKSLEGDVEISEKKIGVDKPILENLESQLKIQTKKEDVALRDWNLANKKLATLEEQRKKEVQLLEAQKRRIALEEKKQTKGKLSSKEEDQLARAREVVSAAPKERSTKVDAIQKRIDTKDRQIEEAGQKVDRTSSKRKATTEMRKEAEGKRNEVRDRIDAEKENLKGYKKELGEATEAVSNFDKKIQMIDKGKVIVSSLAGVGIAVSGTIGAFKQFNDSAMDFHGQTDAMVSGINSVGAGLMAMPGLWTKVAGAVVMATGAAIGWVRENTGIGKVIKDNEEALKQYQERMADLNSQKRDLTSATSALTKAEIMAADGISLDEQEEYNALVKEAASASPQVVAFYDAFGNAVLKTKSEVDELNKSLDEQITKTKKTMASKAGGFVAESAYLQTEGVEKKESLEKDIKELEAKLEKQYTTGASQEKIDKTTTELDGLYSEMSTLQDKFDGLKTKLNEAVVEPFITSEEAFKDMGKELQGFVGLVFNAEEINAGLSELTKGGKKSTAELKRASDNYIKSYKKGILEVGNAFATLNKKAEAGDEAAKKLASQLGSLPQDVQKTIGEQMMILSMGFDEEQLSAEIAKMSDFFDENGEINTFEMVKRFYEEVGPAARDALAKNIKLGIKEGFEQAEAEGVFDVKSLGGMGDSVKKNLIDAMELNSMNGDREGLSAATIGGLDTLVEALKAENMEAVSQVLTNNDEVFNLVKDYLTEASGQDEGWFGQMFETASEEANAKLLEYVNNLGVGKEELQAMNLAIADQDIMMSNMASTMTDSIDGYREVGTLMNSMIEGTKSLGEEGLFSVDIDALDEQNEALRDSVQTIAEATAKSEELKASQEGLDSSTRALGEAFDSMLNNIGEESFGKIATLAGSTTDELKTLAQEAKNGSVDAAKTLQLEMGRIYATMKKNDKNYYKSFMANNKDRIKEVAKTTGLEASKFENLAQYEAALEEWKSKNAHEWHKARNQNFRDLLGVKEDDMIISSENAIKIASGELDGIGSAQEAVVMGVTASALDGAIAAAGGGGQISASMIRSMKGVDDAADETLEALATKVEEEGMNVEEAKALADEYRRKIAEIAEGKGVKKSDLKKFSGGGFNFTGGGKIDLPKYTPTTPETEDPDPDPLGGGGDDKGGGGGGSDKGSEPETVEDIEDKVDVYRDVETALKEIGRLMSEQEDIERDLYGETKINSMQKRLNLLKEEVEWEKKRQEIAKGELDRLEKEIKATGVGLDFDAETRVIKNYNQVLQAQIDAINAIADTEVDAKNAAIERYEALKALMEEYESHLDTLRGSEQTEREKLRQISKTELEKLDYKVQVELDMTKLENQTEEFLMKLGDGLGSTMEKFLNTSERVAGTIKLLTNSMSDIASMQQHIADIENSTDLSAEDKLAELKKSKEEMIKFYETAMKYRKELEKMQIDAYKEAGKLLQDHIKQFDDINKELKSMMDIVKLTGQMGNQELVGSIMDTQLKTLDSQLTAAIKSRDELAARMANLEEGTEQWKIMRDEVQKLDEQIIKITNESLKLYQDQLKYTVDNVMKDLESALTNNNTFKEVDAALKKQNADKKEYLSTTEKILSVSKLQQKVQKEMEKTADPAVKAKLQKFLEEEVNLLKEKDKLTHYDMERAEKMLGITMKQIALDNARNNKTMMRLVRTSTGNWAYQYVADAEKVEKAQGDLSNALGDLLEFDQKRQEEVQKNMLDAKKDFYKKLEEIMKAALNGEYETQEEFNQAIEEAEKEFNQTMEDLNVSLNTANKNLSESTLAAILDAYKNNHDNIGILTEEQEDFFKKLAETTKGEWSDIRDFLTEINEGNADSFKDKYADIVSGDAEELFNTLQDTFGDIKGDWDNSVSDMITSNTNLKQDTNTAVDSIKDAWGSYLDKVDDVTKKAGLDIDGMKDRVDKLGQEQEALDGKTDELIGTIMDEVDALQALQEELDGVFDRYDDLMGKVKDYMKMLDDLIIKQQKAMNPDKEKPSTGNSGSASGGSTGNSKPPTPPKPSGGGTPNFTTGEAVRVSGDTRYFYDSYGTNPSGTAKAGNKYLIDSYKAASGAPYDVHISNSSGGDLGWVKKGQLQKFDTGGYTGEWGKDGKMAMLHEKEIVLNKSDTKNILDIVKIARQMISSIGGLNLGNMVDKAASNIQQHVTIQAEFPNVNTASEIEKAFANMGNQASQYALQKGRIR